MGADAINAYWHLRCTAGMRIGARDVVQVIVHLAKHTLCPIDAFRRCTTQTEFPMNSCHVDDDDHNAHIMKETRDMMQYQKCIGKMYQRLAAFSTMRLSVAARALVWNVYMITCASYVATIAVPTQEVNATMYKILGEHIKYKKNNAWFKSHDGIKNKPITNKPVN